MRAHHLLAAALAAGSPGAAAAQVTIGTDPSAATSLEFPGEDASWVTQSFVAEGPLLTSLSFWYYGGRSTRTEWSTASGWYQQFWIALGEGADGNPFSGQLTESYYLDQRVEGRYDVDLDYLSMVQGETYQFVLFGNVCGPFPSCGLPDEYLPVLGAAEGRYPGYVEVTDADAYDGGYYTAFTTPDYERDIRFEATFVAVPEPSTLLLMLGGLLLLSLAALGEARRTDPSA